MEKLKLIKELEAGIERTHSYSILYTNNIDKEVSNGLKIKEAIHKTCKKYPLHPTAPLYLIDRKTGRICEVQHSYSQKIQTTLKSTYSISEIAYKVDVGFTDKKNGIQTFIEIKTRLTE